MKLLSFLFLLAAPIVGCYQHLNSEPQCAPSKQITLNNNNMLLLKGEVNKESANKFLTDLHFMSNKKDLYLYLDTNGGSVEDGNKIVNEVLKHNISCIAERAYSMGFVILKACKKRYVTPFGRIMQHQISYGVANEKAKVESYVDLIKQIETHLAEMQSSKIGISMKEFRDRTYNDWWMFGVNAVQEKCADEVTNVVCSNNLIKTNFTMSKYNNDYVYSRCPLIPEPLEIKKNKNSVYDFIFV